MGVLNTDLARQLGAETLGARIWRLKPGQASTRHRHRSMTELYVVLAGRGRMRVAEHLRTLEPLSAVLVEPGTVRQLFNDTDADQLWLIVGAPLEAANTLEMTPEELAWIYPDGPKALPPEIEDARHHAPGCGALVSVSAAGAEHLRMHRQPSPADGWPR
jgi:quercetin dioxygenase-like cupin family protein